MMDLHHLPDSPIADFRLAAAADPLWRTRDALMALAELLECCTPDTALNTGNLGCLVEALAERLPERD